MYPSKDAAKSFLFVPNNKSTLYLLESTEDQHAVGDSDGHFVSPWLVRRLVSMQRLLLALLSTTRDGRKRFSQYVRYVSAMGGRSAGTVAKRRKACYVVAAVPLREV